MSAAWTPGEAERPLPSRPSLFESLLTAALVVAAATWGIALVREVLQVRRQRAEAAAALATGDTAELGETDRFALRGRLVDVNLEVVRGFHPAKATPERVAALVTSVESLAASPATGEVGAALADLLDRLDTHELDVGFLDPDLETARSLLRDALPAEEDR